MHHRLVLTTLLLLAVPVLCTAQYRIRSGMGVLAGPQAATWHSEAVNYRPVPGATAGLYVPLKAGGRVELQPELHLALGGASHEIVDGNRYVLRTLHAVLPVALKYFPVRGLSLQAGGQAGYLLLARSDGQDANLLLNTLELGVHAGVGAGSQEGFDVTLRYYHGLSNTLLEDRTQYPSARSLQLTIGKRLVQFKYRRLRRR
ncbi:MAG: PorT family protein [Flavobacteriales bacterium]|nr:PorT family protein [Flavobacteriales bacterium]MBP9078636.1 PorT family protein [Flavobacteriales bacterium]